MARPHAVRGKVISRTGFALGTKTTHDEIVDSDGYLYQQGVKIDASAAEIDAAGTPAAASVSLADAGTRFTGEDVEAALQELAGTGRTTETVKDAADTAAAAYVLPPTGMPASDMEVAVQSSLGLADSALQSGDAYPLPPTGIPASDLEAAVQTSLGLAGTALQPGDDVTITGGTPVNAVAATGTLTIGGVAVDGETVVIGDDTYEFAADAALTVGAGNIAVDINAVSTKSQGTLTVDTQPTAGDTMLIGTAGSVKTYTFVPAGTANADGEVSRGTSLATAKENIVAAINGSDGHNVAHPEVTAAAFVVNDCVITALIGGVAGDLTTTTETFTAGTNVFDAATLGTTTPGADCTASNAVTALVTEITAHDTQGVGAADGAGDTMVLTADVKGTAANSIVTDASGMANGAFGAGTLAGGVDGTVGAQWTLLADASYLYIAVAANTISDRNWRRVTLGSAY